MSSVPIGNRRVLVKVSRAEDEKSWKLWQPGSIVPTVHQNIDEDNIRLMKCKLDDGSEVLVDSTQATLRIHDLNFELSSRFHFFDHFLNHHISVLNLQNFAEYYGISSCVLLL